MRRSLLFFVVLLAGCSFHHIYSDAELQAWRQVANGHERSFQHESVCSVHHLATVPTVIPAYGGMSVMPPRPYVRARVKLFPNSWPYVNTGWCEQNYVDYVERWVCPACRAAELRWRRQHGWDVPEQLLE